MDHRRGDEPAPASGREHEEEVTAIDPKTLDEPTPALVAATRRELDTEASVPDIRHRLDLHAHQPVSVVRDEVAVGAVEQGNEHGCAGARQVLHGRQLTEVALTSRVISQSDRHEHMFACGPDGSRSTLR